MTHCWSFLVIIFSCKRGEIMKLLGIDNIFFEVGNIEQAILFYQKLGFTLKFKIPAMQAALFNIGNEEPGLLVRQSNAPRPSCFWVEIADAHEAQRECAELKVSGTMLQAATGLTFEIDDPWGNKIGFADYSKKPELGRKQ